jgi:transcriptional regulator with XRE-family HTH domain
MSQKELADETGLSIQTIQRIEQGKVFDRATYKTLKKIAKALESAGIKFVDDNDYVGVLVNRAVLAETES